jgi:hypothetical protein
MTFDANGSLHETNGRFGTMNRAEAVGTVLTAEKPTGPLDPEIADRIPDADLLALMPRVDRQHLSAVRRELARHIADAPGSSPLTSWQSAWNGLTGARPTLPGTLRLGGDVELLAVRANKLETWNES